MTDSKNAPLVWEVDIIHQRIILRQLYLLTNKLEKRINFSKAIVVNVKELLTKYISDNLIEAAKLGKSWDI